MGPLKRNTAVYTERRSHRLKAFKKKRKGQKGILGLVRAIMQAGDSSEVVVR